MARILHADTDNASLPFTNPWKLYDKLAKNLLGATK